MKCDDSFSYDAAAARQVEAVQLKLSCFLSVAFCVHDVQVHLFCHFSIKIRSHQWESAVLKDLQNIARKLQLCPSAHLHITGGWLCFHHFQKDFQTTS